MITRRPTRPGPTPRAYFVAEGLLGLAIITLIAASAVAAIRWHLRAIAIDGQRNQALLAVEQSLAHLRSPTAPQSPAPSTTVTIDPIAAPPGYHWVRAGARSGNQSAALFALVPVAPGPLIHNPVTPPPTTGQ